MPNNRGRTTVSPAIRLNVEGTVYPGWMKTRVTRSLESLAGSFELEISDQWDAVSDWMIQAEDECRVEVVAGKDPLPKILLTGYVDRRSQRVGADSHVVTVSGRDRAAQLVDCSAQPPWSYRSSSVLRVCRALAAPFNVSVRLQDGVKDAAIDADGLAGSPATPSGVGSTGKKAPQIGHVAVDTQVHPGETVFDAVDRFCRSVGILPVSDGVGGILLTRAGDASCTTALVQGENVLTAGVDYDATRRYAKYIVLSQMPGSALNAGVPDVKGVAVDAAVRRAERVLYIVSEQSMDAVFAGQRATWESRVRAGRSAVVTVTVQGWTQDDGTLWPVNAVVPVDCGMIGVRDSLIITETTFTQSIESGTRTELRLMYPDALLAERAIPKGKGSVIKEFVNGL